MHDDQEQTGKERKGKEEQEEVERSNRQQGSEQAEPSDERSRIGNGSRVTLHFALELPGGETIDSNFDGQPATFVVGDGNLLPGFEEALFGLAAGGSREVVLTPDRAFGAVNPENVQVLPRHKFATLFAKGAEPVVPGVMLSFADGGGNQIPGVVKEVNEESLVVDFNHPLAGRDVLFRAKILSVMAPDVQAVEVRL